MSRWTKRDGGWPLNGGLWMVKSRKGEGEVAFYIK